MMNITANLLSVLKAIGGFLAGVLALAIQQTQAATCEPYSPSYYENFQVPIVGPSISTIGEDIAVGSVIYSGSYNFVATSDKRIGWRCRVEAADVPTTYKTYIKADVIAMPFGAPTLLGDKAIYPTNVPGIGVAIHVRAVALDTWKYPDTWHQGAIPITVGETTTSNFGHMSSVRVQLIKTGPIAATGMQQVLSSSFPTLQLSVGATAPALFEQPFMTISFGGTMTMHTKTCQLETPVVDVVLGSHQRAAFTGIGSGTEWKNFDIVLKDCPPFYGYSQANAYEYSYIENTGLTNGSGKANSIGISFTSVHGLHNPRIALLENGPNSAEGIGIEVARRGNYSYYLILNGTMSIPPSLPLTASDGASYVFPLRARYVQYDSDVKEGIANGALVFTVNYQ